MTEIAELTTAIKDVVKKIDVVIDSMQHTKEELFLLSEWKKSETAASYADRELTKAYRDKQNNRMADIEKYVGKVQTEKPNKLSLASTWIIVLIVTSIFTAGGAWFALNHTLGNHEERIARLEEKVLSSMESIQQSLDKILENK